MVLIWPLHANGVTGNALRPHYGDFGWFTYAPLPSGEVSTDALRAAGVRMPQDAVRDRRHAAEGCVGLGLLLLGAGAVSARRGRPAGSADPA